MPGDGGILAIVPVLGGSGPQTKAAFPVSLALGAKATDAINIEVPNPNPADTETKTYIVGAPTITMSYSGIGTSRNVYAQLVDDTTGRVLGKSSVSDSGRPRRHEAGSNRLDGGHRLHHGPR